MLGITGRNVNDVYPVGLLHLRERGVALDSRNGPVLEYPEPVSVCYQRPTERVLFDEDRNANPFLHFFEPLWILAGRNDVAFLSKIVKRFEDYSDNGVTFYGAYGARMESQIPEAVKRLIANKDDRRVVLTIREPGDMWYDGKDQPCNLLVMLKVRSGALNIHVANRSNDYIWGMTGANMPQFSTLQEYLAGMIGVDVGTYHQTTDSMHVYTENQQWDKVRDTSLNVYDPYEDETVAPYPLFTGVEIDYNQPFENAFQRDLNCFFRYGIRQRFESPYFQEVVQPMWECFMKHKESRNGLQLAKHIAASDWRTAVEVWLGNRE